MSCSPEPGDECFVAQVLALPGIMAHDESREEAAREIQTALQLALDAYAEVGESPPAPKNHAAVMLGSRGGSARTNQKLKSDADLQEAFVRNVSGRLASAA